jgi:hypothetical protein
MTWKYKYTNHNSYFEKASIGMNGSGDTLKWVEMWCAFQWVNYDQFIHYELLYVVLYQQRARHLPYTRYVTLVTNSVISHERRKDHIVITILSRFVIIVLVIVGSYQKGIMKTRKTCVMVVTK